MDHLAESMSRVSRLDNEGEIRELLPHIALIKTRWAKFWRGHFVYQCTGVVASVFYFWSEVRDPSELRMSDDVGAYASPVCVVYLLLQVLPLAHFNESLGCGLGSFQQAMFL